MSQALHVGTEHGLSHLVLTLSRKPPTAATCMYHDLRPQTWQPQALTVVVKGPYHGGHSGSHRGPTTAAMGDLPKWPQGPTTTATGDLPQQQPTGDLPQWLWGPPTAATGISHSGHGGTPHSGHRGPPTVAMGTYHSSHREEVGVVAALLQVHHDVKQ